MDSQGALAFAHAAPERDGAISTWTSPAVCNGVMGAIDAPKAGDRPLEGWIPGVQEGEEAGAATPSNHPFSEGPLLTTALRFHPGGSSLQLPGPLFINSSRQDSSSCLSPDYNTCKSNIAPHAHPLPLLRTFYLSPSASRSSIPSVWSYDLSNNNEMPGLTFNSPADRYSASDLASTYAAINGSEGWARRPHHYHNRIPSHEAGQEARRLKGLDRNSAERKASSKNSPKRSGPSRSSSIQRRQARAGAVPQMTREEFEALPVAIQKKYFSTLERLRFARESGLVDGISQHYDDISHSRRRKPHQDRSASEQIAGRSYILESHSYASDSSPSYVGLPEATQDAAFGRGKQTALAILDTADEAGYKLNQQASRKILEPAIDPFNPPLSPSRDSMDSRHGPTKHLDQYGGGHMPQSFLDTFRWLDEDGDLDLRLDDYHANLREGPVTTKQRPSFRRHMSISKIPFGRRNSVSSSRPGTKDTIPTSPIHSSTASVSNQPIHTRRKSRALSLITPKHAPQPSITGFDPAAAHYQDPEARLKLRVYLASPQKFDEAVEFGFPAPAHDGNATGFYRGQSKQNQADNSNMRSFLADEADDDDNVSLSSDQPSLSDPDSPKTPEPFEHRAVGLRHARFASADALNGRDFARKISEVGGYAQAPASSREMTLRMTLTRPDLRAHEDEMYGWQHSRRPTASASQVAETSGAYGGNGAYKDSLETLGGIDHSNVLTAEKGVMKRFWNRVRRG